MPRSTSLLLALALLLPLAGAARAEDGDVKSWVEQLEKHRREPFEQDQRERALRELGKIGGRDAAAALLPVFEDPFVHLHDRAVSAWIAMLKGAAAADTQTWLTARALSSRVEAVRKGAAVALGLTSGAEVEGPLAAAVAREKDPEVLAALADAAVRLRGEPQLGGALLPRLKHKDGRAVLHVALAVARLDGKAAIGPLVATLRHREPLARAGAVLALQSLDALPPARIDDLLADQAVEPPMALAETLELRTQAVPWDGRGRGVLEALLAHPSWRVRAAAVQGALRVWDPAIVPMLIARLPAEDGRLRDDVRRALETYTGRDLGEDPDLWRSWWQQNAAGFDAGSRPDKDAAGNIRFRGGSAHGAGAGAGTKTVAFFDLPLRSKRFAFVFDLSGSMREGAAKGSDEGPTKFDLLKEQFEKTLRELPEDTLFELYVYRYPSDFPPKPTLTRALGRMQPCTPQNVRKAMAWLMKQEVKGWGAFYEPLEALLEDDVDSVILLSDGRPSRGRYDRDDRVLDEFPGANRFRRMAVNTVLVGTKGADRKFMEALAAATGGRFQEAGAPRPR